MVAVSLKKIFFQAEDGILDIGVTGVQTCALPIFWEDKRLVWWRVDFSQLLPHHGSNNNLTKNNRLIRVSRIYPKGSLPNSTCRCLKLCNTRMNLVTLIGPHLNPKTSSPNYNPDARCIILTARGMILMIVGCWNTRFKIWLIPRRLSSTLQRLSTWPLLPCQIIESVHFILNFNCNLFCCSNNYLLMLNFISLMHCICLSWINPFVFTIFKLWFYSIFVILNSR